MATVVIMPRQGQSVESCIITAFNKKVGDSVEKGEILFSYETDKSSFEEPAPEAGTILAIFREEGDDVPCLENVLVIGKEGEDISAFAPATEETTPVAAAPEAPKVEPVPEAVAAEAPATANGGSMSISPRARMLAEKTHADLLKAVPTGPNGRILERDVQKLLDLGLTVSPAARDGYTSPVEGSGANGRVVLGDLNAPVSAPAAADTCAAAPVSEYEDVKLPNIRKIIAKTMVESLSTMAQLTFTSSFDATKILAYRKSLKEGSEKLGLANITLNDMILFAVSRVILKYRNANAHMLGDTMRYFNTVNLGVAVDTERGLMVPTVFHAEQKTLNQISKEAKSVITAAQSGTINPDLLRGATITVSNLGSLGIESFTPIINPPQTCILGVDCVMNRMKEVDGEYVPYPAMGLSLTVDHRVLDGADAARILKDIGYALEHIDLLLAK